MKSFDSKHNIIVLKLKAIDIQTKVQNVLFSQHLVKLIEKTEQKIQFQSSELVHLYTFFINNILFGSSNYSSINCVTQLTTNSNKLIVKT